MEGPVSSILRIRRSSSARVTRSESDPAKAYLDRLIKLIPGEAVALYLAGASAIKSAFPEPETASYTSTEQAYWWGWTMFCFFAVIVVRAWATSSKSERLPPEWPAVAIAATSYLVWVYSLGDAFARAGCWEPLLATLLVLAWTFLVPLLYRDGPISGGGSAGRRARLAPADFSEGNAEQAVLNSAEWLTGRRPSLAHKVSKDFDSTNRVRRLLGRTQDRIRDEHGLWVELADGSEDEMTEHGEGTFSDLATWVRDKVRAAPPASSP